MKAKRDISITEDGYLQINTLCPKCQRPLKIGESNKGKLRFICENLSCKLGGKVLKPFISIKLKRAADQDDFLVYTPPQTDEEAVKSISDPVPA